MRFLINIPCKDINAQGVCNDGQKATDGHENPLNPKAALLDDLELVLIEVPAGLLDGVGEVVIQGDVTVTGDDFRKVHFLRETTQDGVYW